MDKVKANFALVKVCDNNYLCRVCVFVNVETVCTQVIAMEQWNSHLPMCWWWREAVAAGKPDVGPAGH